MIPLPKKANVVEAGDLRPIIGEQVRGDIENGLKFVHIYL